MLENDDAIRFIIDHYNLNSDIVAIYLTGSRANGTNRKDSDYDLHIVYKDDLPLSAVFENGIVTDVKVVDFSLIEKSFIETPYAPAVPFMSVYKDSRYINEIEDLEHRTIQKFNRGPVVWDEETRNEKQQQMLRFLLAIESTVNNEIVSLRHMCKFFDLALNYWFLIKGEWSVSTHNAIDRYMSDDPVFYECIQEFTGSKNVKEKTVACRKIYTQLFNLEH